jgi:hypothetical protein
MRLDDDDELLTSSTLSIVDDSDAPLVEVATDDFQPLELNDVEIGRFGSLWIVNFWPRWGFADTTYLLRLRPFFLSGRPGIPGDDITVRLRCEQS